MFGQNRALPAKHVKKKSEELDMNLWFLSINLLIRKGEKKQQSLPKERKMNLVWGSSGRTVSVSVSALLIAAVCSGCMSVLSGDSLNLTQTFTGHRSLFLLVNVFIHYCDIILFSDYSKTPSEQKEKLDCTDQLLCRDDAHLFIHLYIYLESGAPLQQHWPRSSLSDTRDFRWIFTDMETEAQRSTVILSYWFGSQGKSPPSWPPLCWSYWENGPSVTVIVHHKLSAASDGF